MDAAVQRHEGRQRRPLSETLLWLIGLGGGLFWVGFSTMVMAFSHLDFFSQPSQWDMLVGGIGYTLPPAIYAAAAVAALALGTGAAWGPWAGRGVAIALILGAPATVLLGGGGAAGVLRHLVGAGALGLGPSAPALALVQAGLGALILWDLRSRASGPRTGPPATGTSSISRAGWTLVVLAIWQALLLSFVVIPGFVKNPQGAELLHLVAYASAGTVFAAAGILVGLATRRPWSRPAVIPTAVVLTLWAALLTLIVGSAVLTPSNHRGTDNPEAASIASDQARW